MRRFLAAYLVLVVLGGCAGSPLLPAVVDDEVVRDAALDALGRRLFRAAKEGRFTALLVDGEALDGLLDPAAADRVRHHRPLLARQFSGARRRGRHWRDARYAGLCIAHGETEQPGGPSGLIAPGFVVQRALLIGQREDGDRVAAWIDGTFVLTAEGLVAVEIRQVEAPRWEHSDLELGRCEIAVGSWEPHI